MDYYFKARRVIKRLVEEGRKRFILFPFGERGIMVKKILNECFGIKDIVIIDNSLARYNDNIHDISVLRKYSLDEYTILLTSDNENCYSEIRELLMKYATIEQFVDLFSHSMYFDPEVYYDKPYYKHHRLIALEAAAKEIYQNNIEGDIAECGVYKGEFANYMSRLIPNRKLYLFDTFSGFDDRDIEGDEKEDSGEFRRIHNLDDTSVDLALSNIGYRSNAIVRKGYFPDTAKGLEKCRFAFVSLDTDLYKPIYAGLRFFYPRLNPGGIYLSMILGIKHCLG